MLVLLVEDDVNVRATIRSMLIESGMPHVHAVANGAEALQFFDERADEVGLIVCDWNMPQKSGIEFLREIRQSHPNLPFLLVTARADQESVIAAKEARVTGYLRKPFTYADFQARLAAVSGKAITVA